MPWSVVEFAMSATVAEAAAEALKRAGADGAVEEWRGGQTFIRGFWRDASEQTALQHALNALHVLREVSLITHVPVVSVTVLDDQDWLEGWKQYFSPLAISPRLAVVPSWETYHPTPGQATITLDPGMAFGTGTHGTTYTCLQALAATLTPGMAVCDIGTGSGILAIGAVKLGAGRVVATDNDDLAIRVARDNAVHNGVAAQVDFRVADLLDGVEGPFDLLLANILAPVILQLAPALARVLPPGGRCISSGYLTSQEAEIRAALEDAGHVIEDRYAREDWVTLVSRRD